MCNNGNHELVEIIRVTKDSMCDEVVRWCEYCGAVVVDLDVDNRPQPGSIQPMRFPQLLKELVEVP